MFSSHVSGVVVANNFLVFVAAGTWCCVSVKLLTATGSKSVFGARKLTLMDVGPRSWVAIQLFKHRALLSSQLVLSRLILHILHYRLVSAGAWRILYKVGWSLFR